MENKKVAVVTGGSRGIGKACALKLAKEGYDIAVVYAGNDKAAEETVNEIKETGRDVISVKFDVSNEGSVNEGVSKIIEYFGRIDVLVNNAGITRDGLFMRMSSENWEAVINTNLSSAYYMTNPVIKTMIKQLLQKKHFRHQLVMNEQHIFQSFLQ